MIYLSMVIKMEQITNYPEFLNKKTHSTMLVIAKTKQCKVCHAVSARMEAILRSYPGFSAYEVELETVPLFQGQELIYTVPTVTIYHEGKEILRESRFIDFDRITRMLDLLT